MRRKTISMMKGHLHNSLRALFLSLTVLMSLPMLAVEVEIDGVNYDFNAETKQATVIAKSSGKYSGEIVILESVEYGGTTYRVTSIGNSAFSGCYDLTSVSIGNNVTSIGDYAFASCNALSSVTIGNSVTSIGEGAFSKCSGLSSVTIPNSVTSIGACAFEYCSGLPSVTIPNSVTSIGNSAFYYCSGLTSVTIGNSVKNIGNYVFAYCSGLTSVTIPNNVTSIGVEAFRNCTGLTSVTIPNSVTSIRDRAFYYCSGLTSVTIPNSVTSIGNSVFYYCSNLTSITIPNSVTSIGQDAFRSCSGLTSIAIPNSVKSIGNSAFQDCAGLTSVAIGSGVNDIGDKAFAKCSKLLDVYCYAEKVSTIKVNAFDSSNPENVTLHVPPASVESYKATVPWSGFVNIVAITTEVDGINYDFNAETKQATVINRSPYYNGKIVIPESVDFMGVTYSVTSIAGGAFSMGQGVTSVTIPNSVKSIGEKAFYACFGLTSVHISDIAAWCNIEFGDYDSNPLWYAQHLYLNGEEVKDLVIPNIVTSIGDNAFLGCSGLTSVSIPNSVTSIGSSAFEGCSGLTSVTIPNSVKSIGNDAFYRCSGLTSVHISDIAAWCNIDFADYDSNPLYYAHHLYLNGEEVKDLVIPNSVTSIKNYAFSGCSVLTSVTIPNSVTSIGGNAFSGCSGLTSVHISDIVAWCNIEFGDINSNPLYKAHHLYLDGEEVKDLVIPNSVTSIEDYAFLGCSGLTSVTIGNSVESIGGNAFSDCSGLTSVHISDIVAWCNIDFLDNASNPLYNAHHLYLDGEEVKDLVIPNSVTSIGDNAFAGCSGLTSITMGFDIKNIGTNAFVKCSGLLDVYCYAIKLPSTESDAFDGSNPEKVTLHVPSASVKSYTQTEPWSGFANIVALSTEVDGVNYDFNAETKQATVIAKSSGKYSGEIVIPESVEYGGTTYSVTSIVDNAFSGCSGLTSVTIGNSVTSIGDNAFWYCSGLTSVTIGNSVKSIGEEAFYNCSRLTSVTIPICVTNIGEAAFSGCSVLTSVTIPNSVKSIGNSAFQDCFGLTSVTIGNSVTSIGESTFLGCSSMTSVTIPNSVTSIGSSAFSGCSGLTSVTIPNSVTSIGSSAFDGCSRLTSVTIPNSVESIGNYAFSDCSGLTSVTIGNSVKNIGNYVFAYCSGLTSVTIPNSVESIGNYAFWGCSGLTSVTIPNSVTSIGNSAFRDCSGLTSVTIPNSVKSIENYAFIGCSGLTSVTIPNSVKSIRDYTFCDCSGLTSVTIGNSVTSIGDYAFRNCSKLLDVYCYAEYEPSAWYDVFDGIDWENATLHVPAGSIDFYNSTEPWSSFGEIVALPPFSDEVEIDGINYGLNGETKQATVIKKSSGSYSGNVVIPESVEHEGATYSVTSIGNYAFVYCSGLTSVTIPNSVTSIGEGAFGECDDLTSVTIGNSVTSIGEFAFALCSGLTSVTIPNSVKSIGELAFAYCSKLLSVYCYAENVPSTESNAFESSPIGNATLHVPAGSVDSYEATAPWSRFETVTPLQDLTLTDGEEFENNTEQTFRTLTYTRTLPNLYWNALYVPFEIPVSEIIDKYEVAYVNNVNSYDHNDDGTIDDMRMEVIKIKSGTLNANYPYLIKARNEEAKNMTITLENTTLFQSVETTIDCSSVFAKHEITGIYNKRYKNELPEGAMAISMAGAWQPIASGSYLNPFRLYMTITARDGSPVKVEPAAMSRIRISVLGEDVETDIEETRSETKNIILDLSGRSVLNPVKGGVYIVNGKKVIF